MGLTIPLYFSTSLSQPFITPRTWGNRLTHPFPLNFTKVTTLSENGNTYINYQAIKEELKQPIHEISEELTAQEIIKVKDYMRWFLINPIISQNGLFNKDDSNVQALKKLIKYKIPVNFNKVTTLSENGNIYTNYQAITEQ